MLKMLRDKPAHQSQLECVAINELVPADHLLRKIDQFIQFDFIYDQVRDRYCANNGRPALDPVMLFKMLFVGYLFGIRSERQLMREIQVNVAYRWFLGLSLTDAVPDASTISQNRRRRFVDSEIYQRIFDQIVLQAMDKKLIDGRVIYTDSTHLKANANKHKFQTHQITRSTQGYLEALDEAIEADRLAHRKKPLLHKPSDRPTKEIKRSSTDPDSGYMVREGKPKGFFYLDHRSVDGKHNLITDSHATPASIHDSVPYLDRVDHQRQRFGFDIEAVGLDAGYSTAAICKGLEDRNIYAVIGYRRPNHRQGYFHKREYHYDAEHDAYICPAQQILSYRTTNRSGYREYASNPQQCRHCAHRTRCTQSANATKVITRHVWQASKERIDQHRLSPAGKALYARRKETVERSFADAKQLHGHRYARMRGIHKVREQCLLAAACQNMKKIATLLARKNKPRIQPLFRLIKGIQSRYTPQFSLSPKT